MPSSSFFLSLSNTFICAIALVSSGTANPLEFTKRQTSTPAYTYTLGKEYSGSSFFNSFTFFKDADPTHGYVTYGDAKYASDNQLISFEGDYAVMKVDSTTRLGSNRQYYNINNVGRKSVRIEGTYEFTHGLIVADIGQLPGGICGTWPAFWTLGRERWPADGEIDIIEGANAQPGNWMALHTGNPSNIDGNTDSFSARITAKDCEVRLNSGNPNYVGCKFEDPDTSTYSRYTGGVWATQWTSDRIKTWYWPYGSVPADITSGRPKPSSVWGTPRSSFAPPQNVKVDQNFRNHHIIFDTTFCGDLGDATWSSTGCAARTGYASCADYVANSPSAFTNAKWKIKYVKIFNESPLSSSSSAAPSSSSSRASSSSTVISSSSASSSKATSTSSAVSSPSSSMGASKSSSPSASTSISQSASKVSSSSMSNSSSAPSSSRSSSSSVASSSSSSDVSKTSTSSAANSSKSSSSSNAASSSMPNSSSSSSASKSSSLENRSSSASATSASSKVDTSSSQGSSSISRSSSGLTSPSVSIATSSASQISSSSTSLSASKASSSSQATGSVDLKSSSRSSMPNSTKTSVSQSSSSAKNSIASTSRAQSISGATLSRTVSSGKPSATPSVSPDWTCGASSKGKYKCPDSQCCSQYGWCGTSKEYCQNCQLGFGSCKQENAVPDPVENQTPDWTCGTGSKGEYSCPKGNCCSQYGWCGTGREYCGKGCQSPFGKCF